MKKYFWLICILLLSIVIISSTLIDSSDALSYRIQGAIISVSVVVILWIFIGVMVLKPEEKSKPVNVNMGNLYKDVSSSVLKKYNINVDEFRKMVYRKFEEIHLAMTNGNLDLLKLNLTKDLYDYYVSELNKMSKKNIKNIMCDLEFVNFKIFNVLDEYSLQMDVYLNVRMIDYKLDLNTNEITSGNDVQKTDFEFELTFIRRNNIGNLYNDFVMCKKRCINKMMINEKDIK